MIDEEITYTEKGYYSTDLKPQSNKPVYAVCEGENCEREGGRGRWVKFQQYKKLCRSCAQKNHQMRELQMCETHNEKLQWIDDDITYAEKGYKSTWLKPRSNKPVWCICANHDCEREGGRGRWLCFRDYSELCKLCSHKTYEYRRKISKSNIGNKIGNRIGNKHYEETILLMSELKKGEKNPMYGRTGESCPAWKGGITPESIMFRSSDEYKKWRISVFERDDYTCQECDERGGVLNAHHILPYSDWREPRFSLNIKNGITLCEKCHNKTKTKEYEFFNKYFDIANGVGKYKK